MILNAKKKYIAIMAAVVLLDQISKYFIRSIIPLFGSQNVITGFFKIEHIHNSGAVWGLLSSHTGGWIPLAITILSILALLVVVYYFLKIDAVCRMELTAFSLILGGALGNIIDRLRLGFVTDFLHFYFKDFHWPTFNVSDSCISIGVIVLAWSMWRGKCTHI